MATAASTTAVNVTFIFANYEKKVILATTLASSGADLKTQLLANWPEGSIFDTERWICRCCSANAEMIAWSISISDEKIIFITNYILSGCCSWAIFSIQQFFFSSDMIIVTTRSPVTVLALWTQKGVFFKLFQIWIEKYQNYWHPSPFAWRLTFLPTSLSMV